MPDRITDLVANALRISPDKVTDELEFQSVPEWDSLGHASLILALEDDLGVQISDDLAVELTTISAIRAFVDRHHAAGEARPAVPGA